MHSEVDDRHHGRTVHMNEEVERKENAHTYLRYLFLYQFFEHDHAMTDPPEG